MCAQVPGYVGHIRCPASGVLCNDEHAQLSTVAHQSHVSNKRRLLTTTAAHNITSSDIHSYGTYGDNISRKFNVICYIPYSPLLGLL